MTDKVKFDGKHWIGKKRFDEPLQIHSYQHVAQQTRKMLGEDGIVAIPNARPDEYRYEEFISHGLGELNEPLGSNGKFFYDNLNQIYFVKAQEVNIKISGGSATFLFYNLPYRTNLRNNDAQKLMDEAAELGCIIGVNGSKSNISGLFELFGLMGKKDLMSKVDFFVGHQGTSTIFGNFKAQCFYEDLLGHENIGIAAISGGHRTPYGKLEYALNGGQTMGSSYTEIPKPSDGNFMNDLRVSLRNAKESDMHKDSIFAETIFRHLPSIYISDKISSFFK